MALRQAFLFAVGGLVLSMPGFAQTPAGAVPVANVTVPCGHALDPTGPDITTASQSAADSITALNVGRTRDGLPALALPANYATAPNSQKILMLVNQERADRGLPPLNTAASLPDLQLDLAAYNHSTLLATIPALFTTNGAFSTDLPTAGVAAGDVTAHENSIEDDLYVRILSIPAVLTANGPPMFGAPLTVPQNIEFWFGENVNEALTVEAAVFTWVYADSASGFGHRSNILGCNYTNAGVGIAAAQLQPDGTTRGPFETIDFIGSNGMYVPTFTDPTPAVTASATPPPPALLANQILPDQNGPLSSSAGPNVVTVNNTLLTVSFTSIVVNPLFGATNGIRSMQIVSPPTWGQPDAFGQIVGTLPLDSATTACAPVQVPPADTSPPVTWTCTMGVPASTTFPIQLISVDSFDHVVITTLAAPSQPSVLAGIAPAAP